MTEEKESNLTAVFIVSGIIALIVLVAFAVNIRFFKLEEIEIRGNKKVSQKEIFKRSGLKAGESTLFFSEGKVIGEILKNPWITDVRVTKESSHKVLIEIEEAEPFCLALGEDGDLYYISDTGKRLDKANFYEGLDFPLLIGEGILHRELLGEALNILKFSQKSNILNWKDISEIDLDSVYGIRVLTNDGRRIDFGNDSVAEKWHRVEKIISHSRSINMVEKYINISSKKTAVVDFKL